MEKFKFVPVKFSSIISIGLNGHQRLIERYAKEGYDYKGYVPVKQTETGAITEIELIFEKTT